MLVVFLPQASHGETKVRRTTSGSPGKTLLQSWGNPPGSGNCGYSQEPCEPGDTLTAGGPARSLFSFQLFDPFAWWDQDLSLSNEAHSVPYLFFWAIQTSGRNSAVGTGSHLARSPTPTFPSLRLLNSVSTAHTIPDPAGNGNISSVFKMLNGFCQQCVSCPQP